MLSIEMQTKVTKMEVKQTFPPNYDKIKKEFPNCEKQKAVFCYGNVVYNPFGANMTRDLEVHEAAHSKQQGKDPETWWDKYINDTEFRLLQEIEAYGVQYYFLKTFLPEKITRELLDRISSALSGELYGNLITKPKAESLIRHFVKKI